jgi:hypothetical protein
VLPVSFTPEQFEKVLLALKSGTPLDQACRGAHIDLSLFRQELESNSHLAEIVDDACVTAREQRKQARTYNDPVDNSGKDSPPVPAYENKPKRKRKGGDEPEKPSMDWARAFAESRELDPGPFGRFLWLNEKCASVGMHSISPWWLQTMRGFYESGKRCLLVRAGRGAAKSTTLVKCHRARCGRGFSFR